VCTAANKIRGNAVQELPATAAYFKDNVLQITGYWYTRKYHKNFSGKEVWFLTSLINLENNLTLSYSL
jgi:hypothetical protein